MCGLGDLGNREVEHNMVRVCVCHGQGRRSTFPNGKINTFFTYRCARCVFKIKVLHSSSYFRDTIGKKPFSPMSQMVLSSDDDDVRHVEPSSNFTRGCSRHSTISARSQQVIVQMCAGFVVPKSGLLPNTNFQCLRVFLFLCEMSLLILVNIL